MTLKEKVGQLSQYAAAMNPTLDMIKNGEVGSMLSVRGAENINPLQKAAVEQSRLVYL